MRRSLFALLVVASCGQALAQDHAAMGHDMASGMDMRSAFGPYTMAREGSGTSWQPDIFPMEGIMLMPGPWSVMAHGMVNAIHDAQGSPRGDTKTFVSSMAMAMASRPLGSGTLGLRAMVSLDPAWGKGGYPLLFQTGETANGRDHLVDRQHPHDAFMELAGSYSHPIGDGAAAYVYAGLPGEPALGPSAFMHRFSGERIPEAPITHHWLDSTHITMGVVTLGASAGAWKLEASQFNAREPDQFRWNIETGRLDSTSARLSFNPSPAWALQVSHGRLKSPEQLEPGQDITRTSASVMYQAMVGAGRWGTTLAWGRNEKTIESGPRKLDGWLIESTYEFEGRHAVFGRLERVANDELVIDHHDPRADEVFRVSKLSVGYVYDFAKMGPVRWSVGALVSAYDVPVELRQDYGRHPTSSMAYLQMRF